MVNVSECMNDFSCFLPRDATQSVVMRLHVVCLSVRDFEVCFSYRLEYFELFHGQIA